jgi:quercetin dioxygenase-like cupin family protein
VPARTNESGRDPDRTVARGDSGRVVIRRWARDLGNAPSGEQLLGVALTTLPTRLVHGRATGSELISNASLGADVIRMAAGDGFVPHTHPGDHILVVIGGRGTIACRGEIHPTSAGDVYFVEGDVAHAVGAITDHVLLAVGSPHRPLDSSDRMTPVGYDAVTDHDELRCLVCDVAATQPRRLHESGCAHCPCADCHPYEVGGDQR